MWFLRPDSLSVLMDEKAKKSLDRYFSIMDNELLSKVNIARKIDVAIELSESTEELWRVHDEKIRGFKEVQKGVDSGKLNLEKPRVSLLDLKIELAERMIKSCEFCERKCRIDRKEGKTGFCSVGYTPRVSSEFLHHGEEPELVPSHTIFFCGCTFYCTFCQNYTISRHLEEGIVISPEKLADIIENRRRESRNVNWVGGSPTPNLHYILKTLRETKANIPSVWNSNMYMSEGSMKLLDGTQDVYLTDFKYGNDRCAERLSKVRNYFEISTRNHRIAFEQTELIIRHLVLPGHLECCTEPILKWISRNLSKDVRVNIMFQYRPMFEAGRYEEITRPLNSQEMNNAIEIAKNAGLRNYIT